MIWLRRLSNVHGIAASACCLHSSPVTNNTMTCLHRQHISPLANVRFASNGIQSRLGLISRPFLPAPSEMLKYPDGGDFELPGHQAGAVYVDKLGPSRKFVVPQSELRLQWSQQVVDMIAHQIFVVLRRCGVQLFRTVGCSIQTSNINLNQQGPYNANKSKIFAGKTVTIRYIVDWPSRRSFWRIDCGRHSSLRDELALKLGFDFVRLSSASDCINFSKKQNGRMLCKVARKWVWHLGPMACIKIRGGSLSNSHFRRLGRALGSGGINYSLDLENILPKPYASSLLVQHRHIARSMRQALLDSHSTPICQAEHVRFGDTKLLRKYIDKEGMSYTDLDGFTLPSPRVFVADGFDDACIPSFSLNRLIAPGLHGSSCTKIESDGRILDSLTERPVSMLLRCDSMENSFSVRNAFDIAFKNFSEGLACMQGVLSAVHDPHCVANASDVFCSTRFLHGLRQSIASVIDSPRFESGVLEVLGSCHKWCVSLNQLQSSSGSSHLEKSLQEVSVLAEGLATGFVCGRSAQVWNMIMKIHIACGNPEKALKVFDRWYPHELPFARANPETTMLATQALLEKGQSKISRQFSPRKELLDGTSALQNSMENSMEASFILVQTVTSWLLQLEQAGNRSRFPSSANCWWEVAYHCANIMLALQKQQQLLNASSCSTQPLTARKSLTECFQQSVLRAVDLEFGCQERAVSISSEHVKAKFVSLMTRLAQNSVPRAGISWPNILEAVSHVQKAGVPGNASNFFATHYIDMVALCAGGQLDEAIQLSTSEFCSREGFSSLVVSLCENEMPHVAEYCIVDKCVPLWHCTRQIVSENSSLVSSDLPAEQVAEFYLQQKRFADCFRFSLHAHACSHVEFDESHLKQVCERLIRINSNFRGAFSPESKELAKVAKIARVIRKKLLNVHGESSTFVDKAAAEPKGHHQQRISVDELLKRVADSSKYTSQTCDEIDLRTIV